MSFIWSVDLFLELFWRSYLFFEVVFRFWRSVLFIQSASLSLKSCSFFFQLPGQEKKNQVGEEESTRSGFLSPGESVKNQEAEVYFSRERHWGEFWARGGRVFCYGHERARSSKDFFFLYCRSFICLCTQNSLKVKGQCQLNAFKMESLISQNSLQFGW